jgi:hypothetical protein
MNFIDSLGAFRSWPWIAPGGSGRIVRTDPREPRNRWLNQAPIERKSSADNDGSGTAGASAVQMDAISGDIHEPA